MFPFRSVLAFSYRLYHKLRWQMHYLSAGFRAASAAMAGLWTSVTEIAFLAIVLVCLVVKLPWLVIKWVMTTAKALIQFLSIFFVFITLILVTRAEPSSLHRPPPAHLHTPRYSVTSPPPRLAPLAL